MIKYDPIPIEEIRAARERISGAVIHTPLVRLNVDDAPAEIYLKLENLQPIGSFKLRGAGNAMTKAEKETLENGVWTMSAGNHGQGVAWYARKLGLECAIIVPDNAAKTKIDAMKRLGAKIVEVAVEDFFDTSKYPEMRGVLIHPFSDPAVMAGQGTIGLEILEDLPDVDSVVIPFGGGGLSCGVASAIRALKPDVKLYGCEIETAAPLAPSLTAGEQVDVNYTPSFVNGIGIPYIFPEMWDLAKRLLDGSIVVGLEETAAAVRMLVERNHVVAEGAGAVSVAAALSGKAGFGKVVCVVSGGNIGSDKLVRILQGKVPDLN